MQGAVGKTRVPPGRPCSPSFPGKCGQTGNVSCLRSAPRVLLARLLPPHGARGHLPPACPAPRDLATDQLWACSSGRDHQGRSPRLLSQLTDSASSGWFLESGINPGAPWPWRTKPHFWLGGQCPRPRGSGRVAHGGLFLRGFPSPDSARSKPSGDRRHPVERGPLPGPLAGCRGARARPWPPAENTRTRSDVAVCRKSKADKTLDQVLSPRGPGGGGSL